MTGESNHGAGGRPGRVAMTALMLAVGAAGGYWYASTPVTSDSSEPVSNDRGVIWYTCGMHPQVLQREPGICPICEMTLTPKKPEDSPVAASASGPAERKILYWRDPMEPGRVSEHPGKSPMGLDLVPVYAEAGVTVGGAVLRIDPVTVQNMGIRTARVLRGPLVKTIRTVGRVDYDEQKVVYVDTKIMGWIEKLYVDQTGQSVRAGDPLFDIYSPDLWQAQVEFISAVRKLPTLEKSTFPDAVEDARRMVEATRLKLDYFDVSADQVARIQSTLSPEKSLQIRSPADGIVAEKMAIEGMRVMPGMRLYTIADLSHVWVYVDIYEYQLPWVGVGQPATMTLPYIPNKAFRGKVTYIYPYLQKQTRVIKVRLEFANPTSELKPDMYTHITLEGRLKTDALLIPREGYIDSGIRKIAFVDRGGGKFEPRDIQVGVEGEGGQVEVLFGLDEGEPVVTSGQFLLDSESKLKEAVAKMMEPVKATNPSAEAVASSHVQEAHEKPTTGGATETDAPSAPRDTGTTSGAAVDEAEYACPMDRHPAETDVANQGSYFSKQSGKCPLCGMKLVPIGELPWAAARAAAHGGEVAYTCPNHEQFFGSKPGRCPRCDHELEPFKVRYSCPNPKHSEQVSDSHGLCSLCGEPLVAFRGPWLSPAMARLNNPPTTLASAAPGSQPDSANPIPAGGVDRFVCPMHPDRVTSNQPGVCRICSMQLVPQKNVIGLESGALSIQAQIDFLMEHYLGIQEQLAADRADQLAAHALGLVDAGETLMNLLENRHDSTDASLAAAVRSLHDTAIKIKGKELGLARARLSELTSAMRTLITLRRPDRLRWPNLFIYHCPMAQADWIQSGEKTANPYYGFKMLDCGKRVESK